MKPGGYTGGMSKQSPARYRSTNWSSYTALLKRRGSLLNMADLDSAVPDYTTLRLRQRTLAVQIHYRRADGPLNLLVDSTGIKFLGNGEWLFARSPQ